MHFIPCFEGYQPVIFGALPLCNMGSLLKMLCCDKYGTCQMAPDHSVVFCIWLHKNVAQLFIRISKNRHRNAEKKAAKTLMNSLFGKKKLTGHIIIYQLHSESNPVQMCKCLDICFSQLQDRCFCFLENFAVSPLEYLDTSHYIYTL